MDEIERYRIMTEEELAQMRDQQLLAHDPNLRAANRTDQAIRTILDSRKLTPEMRRELEAMMLEYDAFISNARDRVAPRVVAPAPTMVAPIPGATAGTMTTAPTTAPTATTHGATTTATTTATTMVAPPDPGASALEQVLAPMPKRKHEVVKQAIERMEEGGVTFDDRLRLVVDGTPVEGSNFAELMQTMYSTSVYLMPAHTQEFLTALRSMKFPPRYIPNTLLKASVQREVAGPPPTPPALGSAENLTGPSSGHKKNKHGKQGKQKGFGLAALASLMRTHHAARPTKRPTKPKASDKRMYCLYP